jgi:putative salt-induced outer membrane protein YdiY
MKKTIATIVATAGILAAFAETSTNTSATAGVTPEKKYPWESSVSVGLTVTRGNSQTLLFTADFLTQKKTPNDEYMFGLGGAYGNQKTSQADTAETVNDYKVFGQWNHLFTERFYGYVRADALRDHVADLDYRFTVGPGVGYYLLKSTNTFLATEAGATYEAEHLGSKSDSFATVRLAERFEHKFNDRARVWENLEFLPQVDRIDNSIVNFEIGLEASLSKAFALKTYLDDTYQTQPAAGRQKNDVKIVAAVAYKF